SNARRPGLQTDARHSHQATWHQQPHRPDVVFDRPENLVTRQPSSRVERGDPRIFDAAEAALRRRPDCSISLDSQVVDAAGAQPIRRRIRGLTGSVLDGNTTASEEPEP